MAIDSERNEMRTVQSYLEEDTRDVPPILREESERFLGDEDVAISRYFSREFHDLEVEKMWRRVWQMACREEDIPNVGDYVVYDIADDSIIVVRVAADQIKAYHNSCLHRGNQLRQGQGHAAKFRCSYHGWTWGLDGSIAEIPCRWDFPHVEDDDVCLPECQVGTWGGFVFINMDLDGESLESYLEVIPTHFSPWPLKDRFKAAHVMKTIRSNWKVTMEAFLESYHVIATHPQALRFTGDANTQYDIYGRHNRMLTAFAVPSPHAGDVSDRDVAETMARDLQGADPADLGFSDGDRARAVMAAASRAQLSEMTQVDLSGVSDAEILDAIQYYVFPNFVPWAGLGAPLIYRFRPDGNDPDSSIMEVMLLSLFPGDERPPPAQLTELGPEQSWTEAPELGGLGAVFDQDNSNLETLQRGLHASKKPGVTLANYEESRIRHLHQTLDQYLAK